MGSWLGILSGQVKSLGVKNNARLQVVLVSSNVGQDVLDLYGVGVAPVLSSYQGWQAGVGIRLLLPLNRRVSAVDVKDEQVLAEPDVLVLGHHGIAVNLPHRSAETVSQTLWGHAGSVDSSAGVRNADFDESTLRNWPEREWQSVASVNSSNTLVGDNLDGAEREHVQDAGHQDTFVTHENQVRVVIGGHLALLHQHHKGAEIRVVDNAVAELVDNVSQHNLNLTALLQVFENTVSITDVAISVTSQIDHEFIV
jgi:hypothetical protein